jgi:hypothetical protein
VVFLNSFVKAHLISGFLVSSYIMGNEQGSLGLAGGATSAIAAGSAAALIEKAAGPSGIKKINAEGHTPNPRPTQPRENQPRAPPPRDHLDN